MPTPRKKTPEELLLEQQAGMSRTGPVPGDEPAGYGRAPLYGPPAGGIDLAAALGAGGRPQATAGEGRGRRMEYQQQSGGQLAGPGPLAQAKPGPPAAGPRPAGSDPTAALLAANQPEPKAGPASVLDVRPQWGQMTELDGRRYGYAADKTGFKTLVVPADQLTPEAVARLQWQQAYNDRLPGLGPKIPAGFNATQGDIWAQRQSDLDLDRAAAGADAFMRQSIAAQKADADRSLAASQFDQSQKLAQADLAARRDQQQQQLNQQRQEMLLRLDPSVIRGQALTNAAVASQSNPQFDMKAFMANLGDATAANKDAYNRVAGGLGLPATPAAAQAGPGPDYLDSKKKAETVLNNILGSVGDVATGPAGETKYTYKPEKVTPEGLSRAAASLSGFGLTPEDEKLLQERFRQATGADAQKIRDALMQQLATNYLLTQPPQRGDDGAYGSEYKIPGVFTLQENKKWGRRFGRGLAGGLPYNEIVLPDGTAIPYDATDYQRDMTNVIPGMSFLSAPWKALVGQTGFGSETYGDALGYVNSHESRKKAAAQQLPQQSALLRALYGIGGQ